MAHHKALKVGLYFAATRMTGRPCTPCRPHLAGAVRHLILAFVWSPVMIAVPVDSTRCDPATISEHFGDAAYFALYNCRGQFIHRVVNQGRGSGRSVSRFLAGQGVEQVVFRHLGDKLFGWLTGAKIASFALSDPSMPIDKVVRALRERRLERVTDASLGRLLHPAGPGTGCECERYR